ncbi:MAG: acetylxylan esterase [Firmicutes bacterium]|nr:acetylxylan esterase [Bacillota bacterium]
MNPQYSEIAYLDSLYDKTGQAYAFRATNRSEWAAWRREFREKLIEILGGFPASKVPLEPVMLERVEEECYWREKIAFNTEEGLSVPAYVLVPKNGKPPFPAVIAQHGHGRGKDDSAGVVQARHQAYNMRALHYTYGRDLACQGYLVVVPDARLFGDRSDTRVGGNWGTCHHGAAMSLLYGKTVMGGRVWDIIRTIDYLETRPDALPGRVGCLGLSGGGMITLYSAAIDDRITASVISGYLCTFRGSIMEVGHCLCNYVPGILKYGEMYDIAALIAPKPLFIEAGTRDPIFPVEAVQEAYKKLRRAYELVGAPESLDIHIFDGQHEWRGERSYPWLDAHLKL